MSGHFKSCYKCTERYVTETYNCHEHCAKYKAEKQAHQELLDYKEKRVDEFAFRKEMYRTLNKMYNKNHKNRRVII